jgi:2-polyprenyl-6-methoxyphenol hydroxylase-like FAD-dependent oxidoreductase
MGKLEVMIIGAGTGGLALTHGLRAAGIAVRVFERDHKLTDRLQGYRLTINARGARALQLCLPKSNFERYITASAKVSTAVSFFDHKLRRLLSVGLPSTEQTAVYAARPISRVALREVLFEGLEDVVAFSKTFDDLEFSGGLSVRPVDRRASDDLTRIFHEKCARADTGWKGPKKASAIIKESNKAYLEMGKLTET